MTVERLSTTSPARGAAVGLASGAVGLHTGLLYFDAEVPGWRIVHLAMHERLTVTKPSECAEWVAWGYLVPDIDPIELDVLATFCAQVARVLPRVTYGFRFDETKLAEDGAPVLGEGEVGLTCATYVMAMFDYAKIAMIHRDSWKTREEDLAAQTALVALMRERQLASQAHIDAIEADIGCLRYRAEEVAAASAEPDRPVEFVIAEPAGQRVRSEFEHAGAQLGV